MLDGCMIIDYKFNFNNEVLKEFSIQLSRSTLGLPKKKTSTFPAWTQLQSNQCPNCPLDPQKHPNCPIAVNLVEIIETFRDFIFYNEAEITVSTHIREFRKRTNLEEGLSSLIGIYMVTSGCPIMDKLRPMVFLHLPFATVVETMYRAASMYLLAQYFLQKKGKKADWELKGLVSIYEDINNVNLFFRKRLLSINPKDPNLNALFNLNCFAVVIPMSIVDEGLKELERLFHPYY